MPDHRRDGRLLFKQGKASRDDNLRLRLPRLYFCSPKDIDSAKALYADIKGRVERAGRKRGQLKILPAAMIIVGDSKQDAREKRLKLDSLVHYDSAIASLSISLGVDVSGLDPNSLLPDDLPETNASKTSRESVEKLAKQEGLTIRQLAQRYGGYSGLTFLGSPSDIAEEMETWLREEASDGFTCTFPFLPQGLEEVTDRLIPELQRRGLFRNEYTGSTLREHFGLSRPENRFFTEES